MRIFHRLLIRCLACASFVISFPASAYLQFTYTSPELPLIAAFYDGSPWEDYPHELREPLSFTLSFKAEEQDLSLKPVTHFFMDDFVFSLNAPVADGIFNYPMRVSPVSYGRVSLNKKGEIVGWNLIMTITELITPETDMQEVYAADRWETIVSRGGAGTCNCDVFTSRVNVHTWHYVWIQLAPLRFDYSNSNSVDNWTLEKIAVPEPTSVGLLLMGALGFLGIHRLRT